MDKPAKTLTVIQPDGTTTTHEPANGKKWTLEEWRALIGGGWVETLRFPGHNSTRKASSSARRSIRKRPGSPGGPWSALSPSDTRACSRELPQHCCLHGVHRSPRPRGSLRRCRFFPFSP